MIYFAYRSTSYYKSDPIILGVYTSIQEAIDRIEREGPTRGRSLFSGTYWKDSEYRYHIVQFPLGDCPTDPSSSITSRGILCDVST